MSEEENPTRPQSYKTIGVKLQHPIHAQLSAVTEIDDIPLQVALVRGAKLLIESRRTDPKFQAKVAARSERIKREAEAQVLAISSLLDAGTPDAVPTPEEGARLEQLEAAISLGEQAAELAAEVSTPEADAAEDATTSNDGTSSDEETAGPPAESEAKKTTRRRASTAKS
ncbi:hypothetical protein EV138_1109 [Kribbella voronezhensis]|uniref:Uncharacterized protein n=1 Tax=Kribbella voronezhensis TaxID=2512212 RepID=A0A4R7T765_9ACTN|nr:hypothetical protein [Kribbella voronezhensis]TDU87585.1 hypothetical protein EV138_1109 [Kribbella voronezhensis]